MSNATSPLVIAPRSPGRLYLAAGLAFVAAFALFAAGVGLTISVALDGLTFPALGVLAVTGVVFYGGQRAAYNYAERASRARVPRRRHAAPPAVVEQLGRHAVDTPTSLIPAVRGAR